MTSRGADALFTLAFPEGHRWVAFGARHLDLLDRPEVYAKIASWLLQPTRRASTRA